VDAILDAAGAGTSGPLGSRHVVLIFCAADICFGECTDRVEMVTMLFVGSEICWFRIVGSYSG
jgi:hypothetical protein